MTEIVNLRRARKRSQRAAGAKAADENAARHGTSKGERRRREADRAKAEAHLDGHKREIED